MPLARLQQVVGRSLRAKVAGDDADAAAQQIWDTPGERWFAPGDAIWTVHGDAAMFPGGIAALLLQSLHPLAMAGVAGHSGFRGDPWGRLQRTSTYLATTTYGPVDQAERLVARIRGVHRRVQGTDERGRPYRADDPHLLAWVHVAEVQSFLRAHQAFGAERLSAAAADDYVAQSGRVAERLGVVDPPQTVTELDTRLAAYRPELEASAAARDAARFLLLSPPLSLAARPGYGVLAAGALSLLDPWVLRELAVPLPATLTRWVGRPLGHVGTRGVRWAMAGVGEHRSRSAA